MKRFLNKKDGYVCRICSLIILELRGLISDSLIQIRIIE